jgi:cytoskeletal protein CcmA (bactofilin family)
VGDKPENISIIDNGVTVDGMLSTRGKLIIKGTVKGGLEGTEVIIAAEGAVYAETRAASITVGGVFEGELNVSEELKILPNGSCSGKIVCKDLVVEAGGKLNGEVTYKTSGNMTAGENFSGQVKT